MRAGLGLIIADVGHGVEDQPVEAVEPADRRIQDHPALGDLWLLVHCLRGLNRTCMKNDGLSGT